MVPFCGNSDNAPELHPGALSLPRAQAHAQGRRVGAQEEEEDWWALTVTGGGYDFNTRCRYSPFDLTIFHGRLNSWRVRCSRA